MLRGDLTCHGSEAPILFADFLHTMGNGNRLDWNWPDIDLVIGICMKSTASSHHKNTAACALVSEAQDAIDLIKVSYWQGTMGRVL